VEDVSRATMGAHNESDGHAANDGGNAILNRLRGMWQFANFAQWIYIFGKAIRLDDSIDIEVSSLLHKVPARA
jgi:hypothetical protein